MKPGDTVVCVSKEFPWHDITIGKEYKIDEVLTDRDDMAVSLKYNDSNEQFFVYLASCFEVVESKPVFNKCVDDELNTYCGIVMAISNIIPDHISKVAVLERVIDYIKNDKNDKVINDQSRNTSD